MLDLYPSQQEALSQLRSGCILRGGVGTGKSLTSLYFYRREGLPTEKKLLIITTPIKRDKKEWDRECEHAGIDSSLYIVDSWNNMHKYESFSNGVVIFDEQKTSGSGTWAKKFVKIARNNLWLLLSATPGDKWPHYCSVFVANDFYRNRTEFYNRHVIYAPRVSYPKIIGYREEWHILQLIKRITVYMRANKVNPKKEMDIVVPYDENAYELVWAKRWNLKEDRPILNVNEMCYLAREVSNSHPERYDQIRKLQAIHRKIIIFYNFNYELELLKNIGIPYSEYNGQRHDPIPSGDDWLYFVQYNAGSEAWECIVCDTIIFLSLNYSYRIMEQSAGRIDRGNTPFERLYYYRFYTKSKIDHAIRTAIRDKELFNERTIDF